MKPLTKSLHTVTAVSRLAAWMLQQGAHRTAKAAVKHALSVLGYSEVPELDPTFVAAIEATRKLTA